MPINPNDYLAARRHVVEAVRQCRQSAGGDESRALTIWLDMIRQTASESSGKASRRRTSAATMVYAIACDVLDQEPALTKIPKPR